MNINKWNAADSGPKLASVRGLVVKHSETNKYNSIRAILPIPQFNLEVTKPLIAAYFEVQIVNDKPKWFWNVGIGFCTKQFPLEGKWLGNVENSIGIWGKSVMYINGQYKGFGNYMPLPFRYFQVGDVIGAGIIYFPANLTMKCFSTINGHLLGTFELPAIFARFQLFPAATFYYAGDSIHANFGQEEWRFDPSQILQ